MTSKITQAQQQIEEELVERVVASFEDTDNPRLKELMQSLTKHLHNFVREVRLTEDEWNTAIQFLTDVGHITDDKRQEFILLSDVLGVSMQTINVSNQTYKNATEATVFGPFFVDDAPEIPSAATSRAGPPVNRPGSLARSKTPMAIPSPMRASKYGKPMMTGSTTSNTLMGASPGEHTCTRMKTVPTTSGA